MNWAFMVLKKIISTFALLLSFLVAANTPNPPTKQTDFLQYRDLMEFEYRASKTHLDLLPKDLTLIDEYIKLNDEIVLQDYEKARGTGYLLWAVYHALLNNKLPESYLEPINQLTITVNNYDKPRLIEVIGHYFVRDFRKMMWLIELRRIKEHGEFIHFLQHSLKYDSDNELILKVLIQHNLYPQIQQWFTASEIKGFNMLVEHLKIREQITIEINANQDTFNLLKTEYIQLIDHVFRSFAAADQGEKELMIQQSDWLLRQLREQKNDPEIENFLKQINSDWLQFNHESLILMTGDDKDYTYRSIYSELKIMRKIDELNPEYDYFHYAAGYRRGSRKLIDEHLKIIKGEEQ